MAADKSRTMTQFCDITECYICLKTFTDPRMLPCIHTFCFQCLQDMAEKSNKKPEDEIQCPVCRKEFTLPGDGIQDLQKNFFMASLTKVRNSVSHSKMTLTCDICKANNDSTDAQISEATMRCLVCLENLCEGCYKMHKWFKILRNHEIIKIGSQFKEKEALKTLQVMNCDIHRGKPLGYYCADCKKVICVYCFVESHKAHDCTDVNTVEEEFRQSLKSNANIIATLVEELLAKKKKMETKEDFLNKIAIRENEILQHSKELKDMIDEHTKSLISSLDKIKNRHLKDIQMEEEELDRRLAVLESFSRYCDELRSTGSASEICRIKDELLRRADELEEDHEAYIMQPHVLYDVSFQATDVYSNWPTTTNGNIVGSVKENVKQVEHIGLAITTRQKMYKINLLRHSKVASCNEDVLPTIVHDYTATAVYNNTMFLSGVGNARNEIWKYNFDSGWKGCGSLVQRREGHCAEFIGETLYICGGDGQAIAIKSIEAYNALTEKSAMVGQLKFGVHRTGCVAYRDSIYIFGGWDEDRVRLDCVQVYNAVENDCTILSTPMPRPFPSFRSVLWKNYAILLGRDKCFILDLNEKIWQERQQFKSNESLLGMVAENGRIFVFFESWRNNVRYERASSILNNEVAKWKISSHVIDPFYVCAITNLTSIK